MKKHQSFNFFYGLAIIFLMMTSQSLSATNASIANWPDKQQSVKIIYQMIQQAKAEFASVGKTSNTRAQVKFRYLNNLSDLVKGTSETVQTSFDNNHSRHIDQSNLTQAEIDVYNSIKDEIEAYVLIAG